MKTKLYFYFCFFFVFGVVVATSFSYVFVSHAYDISLATLETEQAQKVATTGFYEQKVRGIIPNVEIWVYETPNKDLGYQVIEYGPNYINSIGYGPEAKSRTYLRTNPMDGEGNRLKIPYEKVIDTDTSL